MVDQLGGKGKIIIMNGPAGVSVSDDRRKGAQPVLDANKGIEIITETNTEYNVAPAQEAMTSLLFANPEIDGVLSLSGAIAAGAVRAFDRQGRDPVPITGENARQFLELWKEKRPESLGDHAAQLAWCILRLCSRTGPLKARIFQSRSRFRFLSSMPAMSILIWRARTSFLPTVMSIRTTTGPCSTSCWGSKRRHAGFIQACRGRAGSAARSAQRVQGVFRQPGAEGGQHRLAARPRARTAWRKRCGQVHTHHLLSGALPPDSGNIVLEGAALSRLNPAQARKAGIAVIQQELSLTPELSIAENIGLGAYPRRFGLIDYKALHGEALAVCKRVGLTEPLETPVGNTVARAQADGRDCQGAFPQTAGAHP